jgi:pantetheine-phosphate adenylyltransferase
MKKIAIFPGSFDPFTKGHQDIVLRGLKLFDEIVIAIGHNSNKKRYFEIEGMISAIESCFKNVRLYLGSWSYWITYEENPIEQG